jgi:hypothetical protein
MLLCGVAAFSLPLWGTVNSPAKFASKFAPGGIFAFAKMTDEAKKPKSSYHPGSTFFLHSSTAKAVPLPY